MVDLLRKIPNNKLLLDHYLDGAIEAEADAICDGEEVYIIGIMEHIEPCGIHSGDSNATLPPFNLGEFVMQQIKDHTRKIALALKTVGLINIQFAIKDDKVYVIELNNRDRYVLNAPSGDQVTDGETFEITSTHYGPHHGAMANVVAGEGFAEIALAKARAAQRATGVATIADDVDLGADALKLVRVVSGLLLEYAFRERPWRIGFSASTGRKAPIYRWLAARFAKKLTGYNLVEFPEGVPMTTQERAYTSPIWYTP